MTVTFQHHEPIIRPHNGEHLKNERQRCNGMLFQGISGTMMTEFDQKNGAERRKSKKSIFAARFNHCFR
jgi:hypothetical protein